jgi:hypothetical protein
MKDLLRLPALLVFFFVLLLLLLTGVDVLSTWGTGLSAGREQALALAGARLLPALRAALPVSVLAALALLLFRITLKPGNRFLSIVVPLAISFLLLVLGFRLLDGLERREGARAAAAAEGAFTPERFLAPGYLNEEAGGKILYPTGIQGPALEGIVAYDPEGRPPRLRYAAAGVVEVTRGGVRVRFSGATQELDTQAVYAPVFQTDPALRPLLEDVHVLNGEIARLYAQTPSAFVLFCFALVFAFFAAGLFVRVSRWPLLNVVLGLVVLRGYLYLVRLLAGDMAGKLQEVFGNPGILGVLPALVLLVLGALFLLVEVLFVPRRREEPDHA